MIYGALIRTNENIITQAKEKNIGIICRGAVKKYFDYYDELFKSQSWMNYVTAEKVQLIF